MRRILGLFQLDRDLSEDVVHLVEMRDEARGKKDYAASDKIRRQLMEMGYIVEDTSGKTVVRKRV